MKPLIFHSEAEAELRDAIAWYERERPGLGDEFWREVQDVLQILTEHPDVGGSVLHLRVLGGARRLLVRRFPYFVFYRQLEHGIQIVAIAHQSRRPGYWRSRTD